MACCPHIFCGSRIVCATLSATRKTAEPGKGVVEQCLKQGRNVRICCGTSISIRELLRTHGDTPCLASRHNGTNERLSQATHANRAQLQSDGEDRGRVRARRSFRPNTSSQCSRRGKWNRACLVPMETKPRTSPESYRPLATGLQHGHLILGRAPRAAGDIWRSPQSGRVQRASARLATARFLLRLPASGRGRFADSVAVCDGLFIWIRFGCYSYYESTLRE